MATIIPFDAHHARRGQFSRSNTTRRSTRRHNRKLSIWEKLLRFYKKNSINIACGSLMFTNAYNHRLYCALNEG
jgi:hypothetical protein